MPKASEGMEAVTVAPERLRHVTGNALDHALFAAAQLNHVAIRVAHKH